MNEGRRGGRSGEIGKRNEERRERESGGRERKNRELTIPFVTRLTHLLNYSST